MHGCMTEYVFCNHPRADGRIAVEVLTLVSISVGRPAKLPSTRASFGSVHVAPQ